VCAVGWFWAARCCESSARDPWWRHGIPSMLNTPSRLGAWSLMFIKASASDGAQRSRICSSQPLRLANKKRRSPFEQRLAHRCSGFYRVLLPSALLFFQRALASALSLARPAADMRRLRFLAGLAAARALRLAAGFAAANPLRAYLPPISAATLRASSSFRSSCAMYSWMFIFGLSVRPLSRQATRWKSTLESSFSGSSSTLCAQFVQFVLNPPILH
jgi:hypothetical protein